MIFDASVLLDVVRSDAHVSRSPPGARAAADSVLRLVDEHLVEVVVPDLVVAELRRNRSSVESAAFTALRETRNRIQDLGGRVPGLLTVDFQPERVIEENSRTASRLLSAATIERTTFDDVLRSDQDYADQVAPAQDRASSSHDARIFHVATRVASERGQSAQPWFLVRNPKDYDVAGSGGLRPKIRERSEQVGLSIVSSIRDFLRQARIN